MCQVAVASWHLTEYGMRRNSHETQEPISVSHKMSSQIAKFMGPTWGPPGSSRPQMGPMLVPWNLLLAIRVNNRSCKISKLCDCILNCPIVMKFVLAALLLRRLSNCWSYSITLSNNLMRLWACVRHNNETSYAILKWAPGPCFNSKTLFFKYSAMPLLRSHISQKYQQKTPISSIWLIFCLNYCNY